MLPNVIEWGSLRVPAGVRPALIVNGTEIFASTGQSARTVGGAARGRAVRSLQPLMLHTNIVAEQPTRNEGGVRIPRLDRRAGLLE